MLRESRRVAGSTSEGHCSRILSNASRPGMTLRSPCKINERVQRFSRFDECHHNAQYHLRGIYYSQNVVSITKYIKHRSLLNGIAESDFSSPSSRFRIRYNLLENLHNLLAASLLRLSFSEHMLYFANSACQLRQPNDVTAIKSSSNVPVPIGHSAQPGREGRRMNIIGWSIQTKGLYQTIHVLRHALRKLNSECVHWLSKTSLAFW